jgi:hypothetical protein
MVMVIMVMKTDGNDVILMDRVGLSAGDNETAIAIILMHSCCISVLYISMGAGL